MERVYRACLSIPDDKFVGFPAGGDISAAAIGSLLRELCHDLIEPTAPIRWLVPAADAVRSQHHQQLQRLRAGNQETCGTHFT